MALGLLIALLIYAALSMLGAAVIFRAVFGRSERDAVVEVHDVGRLRSAAGGSANANLIFDNIVATLEIVDSSHPVPNFKRRRAAPDED